MLMLIGKQRKQNSGAFWMLCPAFSGGQVVMSKLTISIPSWNHPNRKGMCKQGVCVVDTKGIRLSLQSDCLLPASPCSLGSLGTLLMSLWVQEAELVSWSPKSVSFRSHTSLCICALLNQPNLSL